VLTAAVLTGACARTKPTAPCPPGNEGSSPIDRRLLIDDFADGAGPLDGRTRTVAGSSVREQFEAPREAHFDPAPAVQPACGGVAHIKGDNAGAGSTFTLVFSGSGAGPGASQGFTFRAARGTPQANAFYTVVAGFRGSEWGYSRDFRVDGGRWQKVDVRWSDLRAPGAPPFSPATLNQIVFPLMPGAPIDLLLDDLAFLP